MDIFKAIYDFFASPLFRLIIRFTLYFIIAVWVSLAYWAYRDAKKRGSLPIFWALFTLLFSFPGFLIYLILRPPEYLEDVKERELEIKTKELILRKEAIVCPSCLRPIEKDFLVCPYCFKKLKKVCPTCNKPLKLDWSVCPYCQTTL